MDSDAVENVIDIDAVGRLEFSPGANPLWRLGDYEPCVFPPAIESVNDLDFEETITGLRTLEERHSDRLSLTSVGQSPGWFNHALGDLKPSNVWVAELTNDIDDEVVFADEEKVIYACSIHGDERSGADPEPASSSGSSRELELVYPPKLWTANPATLRIPSSSL